MSGECNRRSSVREEVLRVLAEAGGTMMRGKLTMAVWQAFPGTTSASVSQQIDSLIAHGGVNTFETCVITGVGIAANDAAEARHEKAMKEKA